jgi:hypothetical protein
MPVPHVVLRDNMTQVLLLCALMLYFVINIFMEPGVNFTDCEYVVRSHWCWP